MKRARPTSARVVRARRILARSDEWIEDGGLLVRAGRIERVLRGPSAVRRAVREQADACVDLGEHVVAPGLVDAHAHLELGGLRGAVRARRMVPWTRALVRERLACGAAELRRAVLDGAAELLRSGTTAVGDVDSSGAAGALGAALRLRAVVYRELLDARDPVRLPAQLARVRATRAGGARVRRGLSPHAPHTVSDELLAAAGRWLARGTGARSAPRAVAIHWSETEEELEWLATGRGPFRGLLGAHAGGASGLERIERAGLLGPRTALIHGNHPRRGEPRRIAEAGAVVVHCPGTHRFFGREPFPLARYRRAGVRLALGTDSLASNEALDMRREMRLFREAHPGVAPERVWEMATLGGARALGREGELGELVPGAPADLAVFAATESRRAPALEALTWGRAAVAGVWVSGRPVRASGGDPG